MNELDHQKALEVICEGFKKELAHEGGTDASLGDFRITATSQAGSSLDASTSFFVATAIEQENIDFQSARAVRRLAKDLSDSDLIVPGSAVVCAVWPNPAAWSFLCLDVGYGDISTAEPTISMILGMNEGPVEIHLAERYLVKRAFELRGSRPTTNPIDENEEKLLIDNAMENLIERGLESEVLNEWRCMHAFRLLNEAAPKLNRFSTRRI